MLAALHHPRDDLRSQLERNPAASASGNGVKPATKPSELGVRHQNQAVADVN
jgi:hypothetical protein